MVDNKKIKNIETRLNREIKERKRSIVAITTKFEELESRLKNDTEDDTRLRTNINNDMKELRKMKSEITSYTLQLITIIIGIFALLVTVIFFIFKKEFLNDLVWVIRLDIIFVLVLIAWFIIWFWKEDIFHWKRTNGGVEQMATISELEKSEFRTRKYLLLGVILGGLFGFIGSFVWGSYFWTKGDRADEWMFWFGLIAFIVVGLFVMFMINLLDKKFKSK